MRFHGKSVLMQQHRVDCASHPWLGSPWGLSFPAGIGGLQESVDGDATSVAGRTWGRHAPSFLTLLFLQWIWVSFPQILTLNTIGSICPICSFLFSSFQYEGSPDTGGEQTLASVLLQVVLALKWWYLYHGYTHGVPGKMEPLSWMLALLAL